MLRIKPLFTALLSCDHISHQLCADHDESATQPPSHVKDVLHKGKKQICFKMVKSFKECFTTEGKFKGHCVQGERQGAMLHCNTGTIIWEMGQTLTIQLIVCFNISASIYKSSESAEEKKAQGSAVQLIPSSAMPQAKQLQSANTQPWISTVYV